jgi:hypothetical protein
MTACPVRGYIKVQQNAGSFFFPVVINTVAGILRPRTGETRRDEQEAKQCFVPWLGAYVRVPQQK